MRLFSEDERRIGCYTLGCVDEEPRPRFPLSTTRLVVVEPAYAVRHIRPRRRTKKDIFIWYKYGLAIKDKTSAFLSARLLSRHAAYGMPAGLEDIAYWNDTL